MKSLCVSILRLIPLSIALAQTPALAKDFTVMAYNVQNLFDAVHDSGKKDYTFLPKNHPLKKYCRDMQNSYYRRECEQTDWTDEKVKLKLDQIYKVVMSKKELPEILALEEVENDRVVERLAKRLGYPNFVMTNSPDSRGIDVALLFKNEALNFVGSEQRVNKKSGIKTRNLLVAYFQPKNGDSKEVLAVYPVHWPAQSGSDYMRKGAADELKEFIENGRVKHTGKKFNALVLGDFNTETNDSFDGIRDVLTNSNWNLKMKDLGSERSLKQNGSFFYGHQWIAFDRILVNSDLQDKKGFQVDAKSFEVVKPKFATYKSYDDSVPRQYDYDALTSYEAGYSDHFPVFTKVKINNK